MTTIAILLVTFCCSFLAVQLLSPIAKRIGLVDTPDYRKQHKGSIPLVGGIAMLCGIIGALSMDTGVGEKFTVYLFSACAIVALGVADDKWNLSVRFRIVCQLCIAALMVWGSDTYLSNFGDILGLGGIELGLLSYPVTLLAVVAAINAFNMLDGMDGLLGCVSIVSFACMSILFDSSSSFDGYFMILPLMMVFALLPPLLFNLGFIGKNKVFMGDAGSMLIGFTMIWFLSWASQNPSASAFRPVTALWLIAVPFLDMIGIVLRRLKNRQSPFKPDNYHIHHLLLRAGLSPRQTLVFITSTAVLAGLIGTLGELYQVPEVIMFVGFILFFGLYVVLIKLLNQRHKKYDPSNFQKT